MTLEVFPNLNYSVILTPRYGVLLLLPHSLLLHMAALPISLSVEAKDLFLTFLPWLLFHASVSPLRNTQD